MSYPREWDAEPNSIKVDVQCVVYKIGDVRKCYKELNWAFNKICSQNLIFNHEESEFVLRVAGVLDAGDLTSFQVENTLARTLSQEGIEVLNIEAI